MRLVAEGRRLKGQGTITSHSSGMVRAQVTLGTVGGRQQRLTSYHHSEAEAEAWIERQRMLRASGARQPSRLPLGDFLADWLDRRSRSGEATARTLDGYRAIVAAMPASLRALRLGDLEPMHVQAWLDGLAGSPRTRAWKRNMLRAALNDARRRSLVRDNAAALAVPPRQRRPRRVVLTADDCSVILAAMEARPAEGVEGEPGHRPAAPAWRYRAAVAVSLGCGLRQGELLGLAWSDVGTDRVAVRQRVRRHRGRLEVVAGTKADDRPRAVPLPSFARRALDSWRAVQDAERSGDVEPIDRSEVPVFTTAAGAIVHGSVLTHQFQARLESSGLARIPWHALRHATADVLASLGTPQTVTRDILRHASVSTTADHYTGTAFADMAAAAAALDRAIGG